MKIQSLALTRFKAFQSERIEFAPITVLTGPNSSGKTSVLQALCGLTQARETGFGFPFDFQLNGPLARLGDFQNVIYGHGQKGAFSVGLQFSDRDETIGVEGAYMKAGEGGSIRTRSILIEDRRAAVELGWNQKQRAYFLAYRPKQVATAGSFEFLDAWSDLDPEMIRDWSRAAQDQAASSKLRTTETVLQDAVKSTNFNVDRVLAFFRQQEQELEKGNIKLSAPDFDDAIGEVRKLPPVASAISRIRNRVSRALRQVAYVGAVRALPLRYYAASTAPGAFDPYGESVSLRLARWKKSDRTRFLAVRDALVQLELATELNAETHMGEFVQVRIKPNQKKYSDTIADVGFGVSQVLPMLVADAGLARDSGVVLINQPEVHLHPSSQALLGNYFAERIASRQYVIETHSEYLITRLRILIAKGKIKASDVKLYFMMPNASSKGQLIHSIAIDDNGALVDPPKEFFRTYISDSYDLALTSFKDSE